jgi:hypothetical protein
VTKLVLE